MQTAYNPFRQYPGNPRLSIPVRRTRLHPVSLTQTQYRQLAELIAEGITSRKGTDEILYGNHFFCFDANVKETQRKLATGVEFLGHKEEYFETVFTLRSLKLTGVYSLSGNELSSEIDCGRLVSIIREKELTD